MEHRPLTGGWEGWEETGKYDSLGARGLVATVGGAACLGVWRGLWVPEADGGGWLRRGDGWMGRAVQAAEVREGVLTKGRSRRGLWMCMWEGGDV